MHLTLPSIKLCCHFLHFLAWTWLIHSEVAEGFGFPTLLFSSYNLFICVYCICRIGTEHEKFGFELGTLRPMKYEQIAELLNGIAERFDWDKVVEGDNIIGLKQVYMFLLYGNEFVILKFVCCLLSILVCSP